jgi:hypothetical protein
LSSDKLFDCINRLLEEKSKVEVAHFGKVLHPRNIEARLHNAMAGRISLTNGQTKQWPDFVQLHQLIPFNCRHQTANSHV